MQMSSQESELRTLDTKCLRLLNQSGTAKLIKDKVTSVVKCVLGTFLVE